MYHAQQHTLSRSNPVAVRKFRCTMGVLGAEHTQPPPHPPFPHSWALVGRAAQARPPSPVQADRLSAPPILPVAEPAEEQTRLRPGSCCIALRPGLSCVVLCCIVCVLQGLRRAAVFVSARRGPDNNL